MRIVWASMDGASLVACVCSVQAASLSSRHVREIALLTATAATFVLRYLPEMAVAIYLIADQDRHLGFDNNSLFEMFLEIFPSILILTLMWPRKNVLAVQEGPRPAQGRVEQFLREKGLSAAILVFFYLFTGFVFVNGVLSACTGPFGPSGGWPYYISNGASRVLAQVVPLLLFTVMFGSMTFLKSTVLRIAVPFDDNILWHLHVAGVFIVAVIMHCVSSVLIGYDASFDLWLWASGGVGFGLGCIAFLAGLLYWTSSHSSLVLSWFMFPQFIWIHRVGYLMIFVAYPVHIWQPVVAAPSQYIVTYTIFFIFIVELFWRVFRIAKSSEARMRPISRDLFWLDVSIESSRRHALYRSGQWVYLTCPRQRRGGAAGRRAAQLQHDGAVLPHQAAERARPALLDRPAAKAHCEPALGQHFCRRALFESGDESELLDGAVRAAGGRGQRHHGAAGHFGGTESRVDASGVCVARAGASGAGGAGHSEHRGDGRTLHHGRRAAVSDAARLRMAARRAVARPLARRPVAAAGAALSRLSGPGAQFL